MTLSDEILKLQTNLADSYTACSGKGATMPANQNFDNLPDCINSIQGGGGGSYIVPPEIFMGEVDASGMYKRPQTLDYTGNISFDGIKTIQQGQDFLYYLCHTSSASRWCGRNIYGTISFPDLESITSQYGLRHICNSQQHITSAYFPKLQKVTGNLALDNAFYNCTGLLHVYFNGLLSNDAVTSVRNMTSTMLGWVTGCTVHFPSNLQSVISSETNVANGFGGTSTTVLFDLPATT